MTKHLFLSVCALALLAQSSPSRAEDPPLFSAATQAADTQIQQGHLKEGIAMLRDAAGKGDASAEYGLAHYLTKGLGHPEVLDGGMKGFVTPEASEADKAEAARLMEKAAEQFYPLAQAELGWQYEMGTPLPRHPRLSRDYYGALDAKGAVSGHRGVTRANASLGKWAALDPSAEEKQGDAKLLSQDYAGAATLYLHAAQAGSASAAYEYGILCFRGMGVAKSEGDARKWFLVSAGQGYLPAEVELGRDKTVAAPERISWLTKASDAGSPQGEYSLGQLKLQGRDGMARDEAGGWALLRRAADQQETFAKLTLATAYLRGDIDGFPKDLDKAATLALEAAQDGNPVAAELMSAIAGAR